ncbi:hypothetical protein ADICEAN_03723 [Cesiribacter andamanensis AMV16]|uniref:Uncharacterized protein n=2 Tax=Cesiribacter TaxID=1133570 RepID=M7MXI4_9BACT|nr:hypothetical protein ADICEAN_03723 [Cesiribacter andamanensis AMV16]
MSKLLGICCGILLSAGGLYGQSSYEGYGLHTTNDGNLWINLPRGRQLTEKNVIGPSGYLFDEHQPGEVFYTSNNIQAYEALKFRVETNELEVVTAHKKVFLTPGHILGFALTTEGKNRIFLVAYNANSNSNEFMEVLASNKDVMLLQDRSIVYKRGDYNPALSVGNKDMFIEKNEYFLLREGVTYPVSTGKKNVMTLLADKASRIALFAEDHSLRYNKMEDVLRLIYEYVYIE